MVHRRCALGEKLAGVNLRQQAGRHHSCSDADFVVGHEERLGVEELIEPPRLINEDILLRAWARSGQHMT